MKVSKVIKVLSNFNLRLIALITLVTGVVVMENVTVEPVPIAELIETAFVDGEVGLIELLGWNDFLIGIDNSDVDRVGKQRRGSIVGFNLESEV